MRAWLVPAGFPEPGMRKNESVPAGVEMPEVTGEMARELALFLKNARTAFLRLSNDSILRAIDETVTEWLSPDNRGRAAAEAAFRASTRQSAATAPYASTLEALDGGRFREWARDEVGNLAALEGFAAGAGGTPVRAAGPNLAVHVLPGNVPLVWLPTFLAFLLMRTPCLIKPAPSDPLAPALFVGTLARKLPALAAVCAVLPWEGGDTRIESSLLGETGALIAYGHDETIRALARQLPPEAKLAAYGSRFAAGVITRETARPGRIEPLAAAAARDVLLYDGKGCLSLSVLFVERGGLCTPREAADVMARALSETSLHLPPGKLDPDSAAVTLSWRGRQKARGIAGKPAALMASEEGLAWTVFYDEEIGPPAQSLCRALWVAPVDALKEIPVRIGNLTGRLHALAITGPDERRLETAEKLAPFGLTRVCAFGELQSPPLSWPHAGTTPFRQFLNWTRVER